MGPANNTKKKTYAQDHWSILAYWVKHGGPHLIWIFGALAAAYSMGLIDVPAWSKDVLKVEKRIVSVERSIEWNTRKLNGISISNAAAEERDTAQQRQLNNISKKLDILINRAIIGNPRRQ